MSLWLKATQDKATFQFIDIKKAFASLGSLHTSEFTMQFETKVEVIGASGPVLSLVLTPFND